MSDWKARLLEEQLQLSEKIYKLTDFIEKNPVFLDLDPTLQELMKEQLGHMEKYLKCLIARQVL